MINRFFNVYLRFDIVWNISQQSRMQQAILKVLHQFTDNVIRERRLKLNGMMNNNSIESINDIGIKQRRAFIDILLNSTIDGEPLSDKDIREEVDTFMFEVNLPDSNVIMHLTYVRIGARYDNKLHTVCIIQSSQKSSRADQVFQWNKTSFWQRQNDPCTNETSEWIALFRSGDKGNIASVSVCAVTRKTDNWRSWTL